MQSALPSLPSGQRDVQGLGLQLRIQLGPRQRGSAVRQSGLYSLLGDIDGGTAGFFFFHAQGCQTLHELGHASGLAQENGFGIFQIGRPWCSRKGGLRVLHDGSKSVIGAEKQR